MTSVPSGSGLPDFGFAMTSERFLDKTLRVEVYADDAGYFLQASSDHPNVASTGSREALPKTSHLTRDESPRGIKRKRGNGADDLQNAGGNGINLEITQGNVTSKVDSAEGHQLCTKGNGADDLQSAGDREENSAYPLIKVKMIKVVSVILAEKSHLFHRMFTGPFDHSSYTMKITESEEDAFDALLEFIYRNKFTTSDPELIIQTLIIADKIGVANAMVFCCSLLHNLPLTTELAGLYLERRVVSTVVDNALEGLRAPARQFLVNKFRDITKSLGTLMTMPLSVILAVFSSSEIIIPTEGCVVHFFARWAQKQYGATPERLEVYNNYLFPLVRWIHVSPAQLEIFLRSSSIVDSNTMTTLAMNSLMHRSDTSNTHFRVEIEQSMGEDRIYKVKPIRPINFMRPFPHCVVYLDFKKAVLDYLAHGGDVATESFSVASHQFRLKFGIKEEPAGSGVKRFGMFLSVENMEATVNMKTRIAVMRTDGEYGTIHSFTCQLTGTKALGARDVFRVPWSQFITDGRLIINGFLHMKVEVRLVE